MSLFPIKKVTSKITPMVWFVVLLVITCGLALGLPPNTQTVEQLGISDVAYRFVILAVLIPYIIIWFSAFFAFARLKRYSGTIKGSKDGQAFRQIMIGMGVLAFGLVIPTLVSLVLNSIALYHNGFKPVPVIASGYLTVITVLITFWFMGRGAHRLVDNAKIRLPLIGLYLIGLIIAFVGMFFAYLVFRDHFAAGHVYYLNTYALIATIIAPYVFAWFMALLCALEFRMYAKYVKGVLYRRALQQFAAGIVIAIAGSVATQFVDTTLAKSLSHSLGGVLIVVYILLAIIATGLIMMSKGAKKLRKIEEV